MADNTEKAPKWAWWLLFGVSAVLAATIIIISAVKKDSGLSPQSQPRAAIADYPICAGPEIYDLRTREKQIKAQLHPDCWSGWVMLPGNTKFMTDTLLAGDLEYKFWDSRRVLVKDKTSSWLGDISSSSFRLRGNGEAIISIEKT